MNRDTSSGPVRWPRRARRPGHAAVLPAVLLLTWLAGCASPPAEQPRSFSRTDLLREAIEEELVGETPIRTVNLVMQGLHKELLDTSVAAEVLQRVASLEMETYRRSLETNDYRAAILAGDNVRTLQDDPLGIGFELAAPPLLQSRDQLLMDWARKELEADEDVLALYLLLRRSTLGDLDAELVPVFIELARNLNHDEAQERLMRVAAQMGLEIGPPTDELDDAVDDPVDMLRGTVTVWVNRGIRIDRGVGVPDRVIGSGFFVDPRGYVLTNYHVISSEVDPEYEGYSRLFVKLPGRPDERVPARVIGYDRIFDLALLKVEIDAEYTFSLSDIRELRPGERVLALGSPGGLDSTITSGIVSASGRRFLQLGEAVQVDVPINPGNSGGPLILPNGQVAGIVFAGLEQFEGVNFAIPSYWVRHFFPRLFEGGEVSHAWMGVSVISSAHGLEVVYVAPGSPAAVAGVEVGSVLVEISGVPVDSIAAAQDVLLSARDGEVVNTLWRSRGSDGTDETARKLIALHPRPFSPVEEALDRQPIEALFPVLFGMEVERVAGSPWGPDFVITQVLPGSIADESSLSVDDPFALRDWRVDPDLRAAFIQILIKKRKAGFLESGVQLGAFLETDTFL
jgi:serine protease Do